jgi:predicted 3-demethylubiquinone-9 3-methyltransferase (glyoxalase superfamily)
MQKITPFLWFDGKAEEAVSFYISVFKNSNILKIARYLEGSPGPQGTVMTVSFSLDGQEFVALNGGPQFKFTPAISFQWSGQKSGGDSAVRSEFLIGGMIFHPSRVKS